MNMSQIVFLILFLSAVSIKGNHLRIALKERNKGRAKAELLFLILILIIGISIIMLVEK